MKKIAIYTIVSINYGNRLQNYALSETLKSLGYDVETIRRYRKKHPTLGKLKNSVRALYKKDKFTNFFLFDKRIKWSDCVVNDKEFTSDLGNRYDAFVIGSDQIWNLTFDFLNENVFLPFVDKKKISYSASFGVSSFDDKLKKKAEAMKRIDCISVREESGVGIVREITGRTPEVVADPTMLLTRQDWDRVQKRPNGLGDKPYVFIYFLGEISDHRKEIISFAAKQRGLDVYNILDENSPVKNAGPSEFVYLIAHSELVITDSFHACVFSILYNKPFAAFDRKSKDSNMSSRLVTLLGKFGLQRKFIDDAMDEGAYDFFECRYEGAENVLENERKKAFGYLKDSLEGI